MSVTGAFLECTVNGTTVKGVHAWEADDSGSDAPDATTGEGGGFTDTDVGCGDLRVTLRLLYDLTEGLGVDLRRGSLLTNLNLYRAEGEDPAYEIPLAIVVSRPSTVEVRGRCECTANVKNKGVYSEGQ